MAVVDLYVDAFTGALLDWTEVGSTPYLGVQDQPTNYIYTGTKNLQEGNFTFADLTGSPSITSVILYLYCDAGTEKIRASIWDGTIWSDFDFSGSGYAWRTADVSAVLNTAAKVNGAMMVLTSIAVGSWAGQVKVDAAYLHVTYSSVVAKTVTDSFGMTDLLKRGKNLKLSDAIGIGDDLKSNKGLGVQDSIGQVDLVKSGKDMNLQDQEGMSDVCLGGKNLIILDQIGMNEVLKGGRSFIIEDTIGLSEELKLSLAKKVLDQLGMTDMVRNGKGLIITDSLSFGEGTKRNKSLILVDSLGQLDQTLVDKNLKLLSSMGLTEGILVQVLGGIIPKSIADQLGMSEAVIVLKLVPGIHLSLSAQCCSKQECRWTTLISQEMLIVDKRQWLEVED